MTAVSWPCFEFVHNGTVYAVPYARVTPPEVDVVFYLLTAEQETP